METQNVLSNLVLKVVCFPQNGKKSNVVLVHKNIDKQSLKDYHPVALLPISERLMCHKIFELIFNLISYNQSRFKPVDSCINHMLSIIHEIYKSFDGDHETRDVFLSIPKTFDKVWHNVLLYNLKKRYVRQFTTYCDKLLVSTKAKSCHK